MAEVIHDIGELLLKSASKQQTSSTQSQKELADATQTTTLKSPVKRDEPIEEEGMEGKGNEVGDNVENAPPPSSQVCFVFFELLNLSLIDWEISLA